MAQGRFSVDEANVLLARLRPLCERARDMAERLHGSEAARAISAMRGGNGGGAQVAGALDAADELRRAIGGIGALGVVFRDPLTGLLDFPSERGGEPVFLCWRLGEERVEWWHERDAGLAGRQRL